MYPYELILYRALVEKLYKYIWVNKATGLGLTEFFLRLILHFATYKGLRNKFDNSQICIVVGPNLKLGIKIMTRLKEFFSHIAQSDKVPFLKPFVIEGSSTEIKINNVTITVFPSNHLDAMRGLPNVSFVFVDESDYFAEREQMNVMTIPTRYIGKSQVWIAMVSTPNKIGGLFHTMENDPNTPFKRFIFSYKWGMRKYGANLFTEKMIEEQQKTKFQDFEREYNNQYQGYGGNLFSVEFLYRLQKLSEYYDYIPKNNIVGQNARFESEDDIYENQDIDQFTTIERVLNDLLIFEKFALRHNPNQYFRIAGIDTGYGSSQTGLVIAQINLLNNKLEVIYENQFKDINSSIDLKDFVGYLTKILKIRKIGVDRSDIDFINNLKNDIELPAFVDKNWRDWTPKEMKDYNLRSSMIVCPITFSADTKRNMLYHQLSLFQEDFIRIHPSMNFLYSAISSVNITDNMVYKKKDIPCNDVWDGFQEVCELVQAQ